MLASVLGFAFFIGDVAATALPKKLCKVLFLDMTTFTTGFSRHVVAISKYVEEHLEEGDGLVTTMKSRKTNFATMTLARLSRTVGPCI